MTVQSGPGIGGRGTGGPNTGDTYSGVSEGIVLSGPGPGRPSLGLSKGIVLSSSKGAVREQAPFRHATAGAISPALPRYQI